MALLPGAWYTFITVNFIANAPIGFNILINIAYIIGTAAALVYSITVYRAGLKLHAKKISIEAAAVY